MKLPIQKKINFTSLNKVIDNDINPSIIENNIISKNLSINSYKKNTNSHLFNKMNNTQTFNTSSLNSISNNIDESNNLLINNNHSENSIISENIIQEINSLDDDLEDILDIIDLFSENSNVYSEVIDYQSIDQTKLINQNDTMNLVSKEANPLKYEILDHFQDINNLIFSHDKSIILNNNISPKFEEIIFQNNSENIIFNSQLNNNSSNIFNTIRKYNSNSSINKSNSLNISNTPNTPKSIFINNSKNLINNQNYYSNITPKKRKSHLNEYNYPNKRLKSNDLNYVNETNQNEIFNILNSQISNHYTNQYNKNNLISLNTTTLDHKVDINESNINNNLITPQKYNEKNNEKYISQDINNLIDKKNINFDCNSIMIIHLDSIEHYQINNNESFNQLKHDLYHCHIIGIQIIKETIQKKFIIYSQIQSNNLIQKIRDIYIEFIGEEGKKLFIHFIIEFLQDQNKILLAINIVDLLTELLENGVEIKYLIEKKCLFGDPSILLQFIQKKCSKKENYKTIKSKGETKLETTMNLFKTISKYLVIQPIYWRNNHPICAYHFYRNLHLIPEYSSYCFTLKKLLKLPSEFSTLIEIDQLIKINKFRLLEKCCISSALLQFQGICFSYKIYNEEREKILNTLSLIESKLDSLLPSGMILEYEKKQDIGKFIQEDLNLGKYLSNELKKTKTNRYKCDKKILSILQGKHEFVDMYINWVNISSKIDKFYDSEEFSMDLSKLKNLSNDQKVIKADWYFLETPTLRYSCTSPNLQCIPKIQESFPGLFFNPRKCFVPKNENYYFISADYDTIELRVCARLMKCTTFNLIQKKDPFQIMLDDCKDILPPNYTRKELKVAIYETMYKFLHNQFYFNLIKKYGLNLEPWKKLFVSREEFTYITTLFHNIIVFQVNNKPTAEDYSKRNRRSLNSIIQCSAAEIFHSSQFEMNRTIIQKGWEKLMRIVNSLHDELIFEVHESILYEAYQTIENVMTKSSPHATHMKWKDDTGKEYEIPLYVNIKIGKNWGELENANSFFSKN